MTRSLSECHSSPLRVRALFFADIFERQCAQSRPPARPPVLKKGPPAHTNGRIRARLGRARATIWMTRNKQKALAVFKKCFPNRLFFCKQNCVRFGGGDRRFRQFRWGKLPIPRGWASESLCFLRFVHKMSPIPSTRAGEPLKPIRSHSMAHYMIKGTDSMTRPSILMRRLHVAAARECGIFIRVTFNKSTMSGVVHAPRRLVYSAPAMRQRPFRECTTSYFRPLGKARSAPGARCGACRSG